MKTYTEELDKILDIARDLDRGTPRASDMARLPAYPDLPETLSAARDRMITSRRPEDP